jgi:glutamyl-tRNA synthetase
VELYNAFGWIPPQFIHVGLLVDMKRQKLSKRDWANVGISSYRDQGILPPALLNFVAMLGWSPHLRDAPGIKKGVLTLRDMIHNVSRLSPLHRSLNPLSS